MKHASLHTIRALIARDLRDAAVNPTTLMMFAGAFLVAGFFRMLGLPDWLEPGAAPSMFLALIIMVAPTFTASIITYTTMAEEREAGMYATLSSTGVSMGTLLASKIAVSLICTYVTAAAMYIILGISPGYASVFFVALLPASLSMIFICAAAGAILRAYDHVTFASAIVVVLAIVPFLGFISNAVRGVAFIFPTGAVIELLRFWCSGHAVMHPVVLVAVAVVWVMATGACVVVLTRRYDREVREEVCRGDASHDLR